MRPAPASSASDARLSAWTTVRSRLTGAGRRSSSAETSAQGHWLRDQLAPDEYLEIRIPEAEEPNKVPAGRNPQALVLHRAAWAADSAIKAGMG
jgi:hypothetical protein